MVKKLSVEAAAKLLADVPSERVFFVNNGPSLKNMEELLHALYEMTDEQFNYHRNAEKNDFYNWVLAVIEDNRLANEIARAKTKTTTAKVIKKRLEELKNIKH